MSEKNEKQKNEKQKDDKWDFADYAFLVTGIIVGVLLVVPEIIYSQFGVSILGGSLDNVTPGLYEELEYGYGYKSWSLNELRALSPLLFLLTTTIVFFQEAFVARKSGGYKGSMFTHTFESLLDDAFYFAITTILVYSAVLTRAMYISWLAGPISWVLFVFIFPLLRKKSDGRDEGDSEVGSVSGDESGVTVDSGSREGSGNTVDSGSREGSDIPWFLLLVLVAGIVVEVLTGAWIAFPLSWLIICVFKLVFIIRNKVNSIDLVFDALYYAFSAVLMAVGIGLDFWITSWVAFPVALLICWIISKFGRFGKAGDESGGEE